jgi:hypothetical protein
MYGLPQTHLFSAPTVARWWEMCSRSSFHTMEHGLLRAIAQLYFDGQTDASVRAAEGWLWRRSHVTTGYLFELLAERVTPKALVEKSPSLVSAVGTMQRALRMFPEARFIHVVQHPRGFAESLMSSIREASEPGPVPYWMLELASYPPPVPNAQPALRQEQSGLDPQHAWLALHANVVEFFRHVPDNQKLTVHIESLMRDLTPGLRTIAGWLGLSTDAATIEQMRHPERSPYASPGPERAQYGNELPYLRAPGEWPVDQVGHSLDGPLSWRPAPQGFTPEVRELALELGYQ